MTPFYHIGYMFTHFDDTANPAIARAIFGLSASTPVAFSEFTQEHTLPRIVFALLLPSVADRLLEVYIYARP